MGTDLGAAPHPRDRWLVESRLPLAATADVVLLDLDGTVYRGGHVIPGAPEVIDQLRAMGIRPGFVTNNASRPPAAVVAHLSGLGVACDVEEVVTSAQAGAVLLAGRLAAGSRVLVVGGAGIRAALVEAGLVPVERADESPVAILQGWSPDLNWGTLAEGAFALAAGLPWVVTNTDLTLPTDRGIAPGNGTFVALLAQVSGRSPDSIAGKPLPPLLEQASRRLAAAHPLAVGDRLDTDIEGANRVGFPSLLVLTGVTEPVELLGAAPVWRPTYVGYDLDGLLKSHPTPVEQGDGSWRCGVWTARADVPARQLHLGAAQPTATSRPTETSRPGAGLDALRALCAAAWTSSDRGEAVRPDRGLLDQLGALLAAEQAQASRARSL